MHMQTHKDEMIRRAVLGLLLVIGGYMFVWPLQFLSFFSGLWLIGLAVGPKEMEHAPAMEEAPAPMKVAAAKPSAAKKTRRKKSS